MMLRHRPEHFGVRLDAAGWAAMDDAVVGLARRGLDVDRALVLEVVASSDKRRFALSPDGRRIRANQGHSIDVDLGLAAVTPPPVLYHGTVVRFLAGIRERGLLPRGRRHVHLSGDPETAERVGRRRGPPVVLTVDAAPMAAGGHPFFRSENGVWLTDRVPPEYLRFPE